MNRIDEIDDAIIAAFQSDGRQSNREVARKLNLSEGTIRQRLGKLQEARAIRFDVVTDPTFSDIDYVAFVRIAVAPNKHEVVLDACARLADLWYVAAVSGRYNIMALISANSAGAAMSVINNSIKVLAGVHEVDVRTVVRSPKHDFREIVVRDV